MYSTKEKLRILREIHNPAAAGADISLLRTVAPGEPGLVRFGLSPEKHTDDILMALLQCGVSREDIVANRRQFMKSAAESTETQEPETETQEPETVSGAEASAEGGEQSPEGPDDSPESQESETPSESDSAPEPSAETQEPETKKKSAKSRSTRQ